MFNSPSLQVPMSIVKQVGRSLVPHSRQVPATLPDVRLEKTGYQVDSSHLTGYQQLCGFEPDLYLPSTYVHLPAFALHLKMITHPDFPLPLLGLVHIRNRIQQLRPISANEVIDYQCRFGALTNTPLGQEFSIITSAWCSGVQVWIEESTMLHRTPSPTPKTRHRTPLPQLANQTTWALAANHGRRYAKLSGDYNPIHLCDLTAKTFGFQHAIIHGMWSKARALATLELAYGKPLTAQPFALDVQFKRPISLPSHVMMQWQAAPTQTGIEFQVLDEAGQKPHLRGHMKHLSRDSF